MENRTILVDTSVFIDFLRKKHKDSSILWFVRERYSCVMSSITLFELSAGAQTENKRRDVAKLCKWIDILSFDFACAELAGEIFRDLKSRNSLIEFRDIFIAATADYHRMELATLNRQHFERIPTVKLLTLPVLNK